MSKLFISSDIHGFFDEWQTSLKEAGFDVDNPEHIIVVLGDIADRGEQSYECIKFVMGLPKERRILIKGNHEELMEQVINRGYFESYDIHNGTDKTVYQLTNIWPAEDGFSTSQDAIKAMKNCKLWNDYVKECVDYYEIGDNIFVHGWIPVHVSYGMFDDRYLYEPNWRSLNWSKARWLNGMAMWKQGIKELGKTIWCGHWHTSYAWSLFRNKGPEFNETRWGEPVEMFDSEGNREYACFDPFEDEGIVAIDSCCAYSHKINVKVLEI